MAVALKDLEIRGAGNVLGIEQSGRRRRIRTCTRLVGEALRRTGTRTGRPPTRQTCSDRRRTQADVRTDLPVDAHLPPDYYIASVTAAAEATEAGGRLPLIAKWRPLWTSSPIGKGPASRPGGAGGGGTAAAAVPWLRHH